MLQLGCSHPGFTFQSTESTDRYESLGMTIATNDPYAVVSTNSPPTPPYALTSARGETHNVVVHWKQGGHSFTSDSRSDDDVNTSDTELRPFTPPPPRERLSYTRYQLELLNGIYKHVKYPNSTQKLLVAKRVGITRDQVKIWFQNRRRKDVLAKQGTKGEDEKTSEDENSPEPGGKTEDNDENRAESMVPNLVMDSVISELIKFKNEHLKSKKQKGKKKTAGPVKAKRPDETGHVSGHEHQRPIGLFSGYDMVSPPNQVTPKAYSDKPFTYIGNNKISAFERPSDKLQQLSSRSYFKPGHSPDSLHINNAGLNGSHGDWQSYLPTPNTTRDLAVDSNNPQGNVRCFDQFDSGRDKHSLNGQIRTNHQHETSHQTSRGYPLPSPGYHLETIPVLSDLLGNSTRQYSCDVRPRDTWCSYGQETIPRERNDSNLKYQGESHGMLAFPVPALTTQVSMESICSNRPYPFPAQTESTTTLSITRNSEPCRPQPQYPSPITEACRPQPYHPSSYTHLEGFQPIPLSSLNNPFHSQHQTSAQLQQWHDISQQDSNYLQL